MPKRRDSTKAELESEVSKARPGIKKRELLAPCKGNMTMICEESVRSKLVECRKKGYPDATCAMMAGVTPRMLSAWLEHGASDIEDDRQDTVFASFYVAYMAAKGENMAMRISKIEEKGEENWQAMAWLLERMDPNEFAATTRASIQMQTTVQGEHNVYVNDVKGTDVPTVEHVIDVSGEANGPEGEMQEADGHAMEAQDGKPRVD